MKKIERIFRNSNNSDEIFDAFTEAVKEKIDDVNLYKILLGNHSLSKDEIIMYAEKLCKEFPHHKYEIYMWVASIFQNSLLDLNRLEIAFEYFVKASSTNPTEVKPIIQIIDLYTYDMDSQLNNKIMETVKRSEKKIKSRSEYYYKLAAHFKNLNDNESFKKCLKLAERFNSNNQL